MTDDRAPLAGPKNDAGDWPALPPVRVGLALALVVTATVVTYLLLSLAISDDPLIMPLDDTYIHFQYARQLAEGHPWQYATGDPASSGGTSLLYPALLAVGYRLGFTGWTLAYWALAIGALSHLATAFLVYRIALRLPWSGAPGTPPLLALLIAAAFAVSGPFVWAALSGMETALFVCAVLLTLEALANGRERWTLTASALMVLIRPEALALAGIVALVLAFRERWPRRWAMRLRRIALLGLPVVAGVLQPALNLLATGSAASSGMQAKSHLYNASIPTVERLRAVLENFVRIWRELLTGYSAAWGTFVPWLLSVAGFAALAIGTGIALRRRRITLPLVMLGWMVALSAGVATLDTAFWQFKRYQLPVMALLFPASAWGAALIGERLVQRTGLRWVRWAVPIIVLVASALTAITFAGNYTDNVRVVRDQQIPMARAVRELLPAGARVGAHDVGLLGYFSGHPLYDVVGLTLPGPASAWRQGPGAIYEQMAHSAYRPSYFAIYPDVQGLGYLVNAGVFGEVLAEFPVELPAHNVAAATAYQAIYGADWSQTRTAEQIAQASTLQAVAGLSLVDWVDVANLDSERGHDYRWWQDVLPPGFATEVYRHRYQSCAQPDETECWATDGGRVLTGGESFNVRTRPGEDLVLVTRVHGRIGVPLSIAVDGTAVAGRVQPEVPGRWVEIAALVPGALIREETTRITVEVGGDGSATYLPYAHWVFQGVYASPSAAGQRPVAVFGDDGAAELMAYEIAHDAETLRVTLTWRRGESAHGEGTLETPDGVLFVHLYNRDELNVEPAAQLVTRPRGGASPPVNWLPGTFEETYTLAVPQGLPAGPYVVAIGFFDQRSGRRFAVTADHLAMDHLAIDDGRLFIGEITVEERSGED